MESFDFLSLRFLSLKFASWFIGVSAPFVNSQKEINLLSASLGSNTGVQGPEHLGSPFLLSQACSQGAGAKAELPEL